MFPSSSDKTMLTMTKSEKKSKEKKNTEEKKEIETKGSLDVSDIAAEAMPSVVSITTKSIQEVQNYYGMFGMYGGYAPSQEEEVEGSGSGIIIGKMMRASDRNKLSRCGRCRYAFSKFY